MTHFIKKAYERAMIERARAEGFENPEDPKNWTAHRFLNPEMSVWNQIKKDID